MTKKILVVDDISSNLKLMEAILKKEDYQVVTAKNGEQAITKAGEEQPDLILLDIMMPGINGYEVCSHLKEDPRTQPIPVIFLSARSEKNSVIKGLETGGQDYITKPFHAQEFLLRVRIHLELKEKSEQLALLNQKLEEMVQEQTGELQEAYERLEKLDVAKNNFLDLVAHELRTPLNGIMGISQILSSSVLDPGQQKNLVRLNESAERLGRFSEMALLITTISSDDKPLERDQLPLNRPWKDAASYMDERIRSKGIQLRGDFPQADDTILGSEDLIKEVFIIILRNAVKYSPAGGEVHVSLIKEEKTLKIRLEDQGPGFSQRAMDQLFSFFSTEDISHHQSGLGLGLALAKMIMDAHDGSVEVTNREEGGAAVTLGFPREGK